MFETEPDPQGTALQTFGGHCGGNCVKPPIEYNRQRFTQSTRCLVRSEKYLRSILRLDYLHNVFPARKQAKELEREKMYD